MEIKVKNLPGILRAAGRPDASQRFEIIMEGYLSKIFSLGPDRTASELLSFLVREHSRRFYNCCSLGNLLAEAEVDAYWRKVVEDLYTTEVQRCG